MPADAIFISFPIQDLDAVKVLQTGLERAGLPAWFIQRKLPDIDNSSFTIQFCIKRCSFFVPVISANIESAEGNFRREWAYAVDRAQEFYGTDRAFILPVVIDDTKVTDARVPSEFLKIHWTHLPGGQVNAQFVDDLKKFWLARRIGGEPG
jgi:hypothetical protein